MKNIFKILLKYKCNISSFIRRNIINDFISLLVNILQYDFKNKFQLNSSEKDVS